MVPTQGASVRSLVRRGVHARVTRGSAVHKRGDSHGCLDVPTLVGGCPVAAGRWLCPLSEEMSSRDGGKKVNWQN